MQALDGCQRDSLCIDGRDRLVIVAESEGAVEILRHWTDVANVVRLTVEAPSGDRQRDNVTQNRVHIDRRECRLGSTIARAREYAASAKQLATHRELSNVRPGRIDGGGKREANRIACPERIENGHRPVELGAIRDCECANGACFCPIPGGKAVLAACFVGLATGDGRSEGGCVVGIAPGDGCICPDCIVAFSSGNGAPAPARRVPETTGYGRTFRGCVVGIAPGDGRTPSKCLIAESAADGAMRTNCLVLKSTAHGTVISRILAAGEVACTACDSAARSSCVI